MKDIKQYRKTCGAWNADGSKLTAPDGWKFDRCGSVNLSIVRVKNTGGLGWDGFNATDSDLKDINIFVDGNMNVVTRGPGIKKVIVSRTRYDAGDELVCQARSYNESESTGHGNRDKKDVFDEYLYLCRHKRGITR